MTEFHSTDRKNEPLIDKRLAALGSLTGRLLLLLCVTTIILYAAATPEALSSLSPKDRLFLDPGIIWALLPSVHLAVIATLLGSMIATEDLISKLKSQYIHDEVPNFFDMFRYQKSDFGYGQVNFNLRAIVIVYSYQWFIVSAFIYGLWHVYLRTSAGEQGEHWELLIVNSGLSLIILMRLKDNLGYKIRNTLAKRREEKKKRI